MIVTGLALWFHTKALTLNDIFVLSTLDIKNSPQSLFHSLQHKLCSGLPENPLSDNCMMGIMLSRT